MRVLVISKNSLWLESFLSLANILSKSFVFSRSDNGYQAVVIYAEGFDIRTLNRLAVKYSQYPTLFISAEKSIRKKYKDKAVFIPSGMAIPKIIRLIELYLGQVKSKKKNSILSLKEELVLNLLREGLTNKEISRYSGLSLSAVKYYLSSIYSKLKIKNRSDPALLNGEIIV